MHWREAFIVTLKENPQEADLVSHRLMLRAGLLRKLASGIYSYLPLGLRSLRKVETIIRQEMNKTGAQEVLLPVLHPAVLWQETGRWSEYGKEMMRLKDRHGREFGLGPTHEEVITSLVRGEVRSYKQLPVTLYQIQTKFRDEIRPRFGVMRSREFSMKDAYSFDLDEDGAVKSYNKMAEAYAKIFARCGLKTKRRAADSGLIGGKLSEEFVSFSKTGEEIEIGHIFKLGTKYSQSMKAFYRDESGTQKPMVMGCYGIGVSRLLAAVIETWHDDDGLTWPISLAPYEVEILSLGEDAEIINLAERLHRGLTDRGREILWDDRKESAGVKFKDADLIGIPIRLVISPKLLKERKAGLKKRADKEEITLGIDEVIPAIEAMLKEPFDLR
ncbi:MAG: proline--tRNA ligase [Candidatus Ratteibacteria bacterium]|nr:proline--tRNA ligase [Candidatus Ratteibacteria bacterium]